jgi:hypothetical protein
MSSNWSDCTKKYAKQNGITFKSALSDPQNRLTYHNSGIKDEYKVGASNSHSRRNNDLNVSAEVAKQIKKVKKATL